MARMTATERKMAEYIVENVEAEHPYGVAVAAKITKDAFTGGTYVVTVTLNGVEQITFTYPGDTMSPRDVATKTSDRIAAIVNHAR
jgi:hypothetical protein